MKPLSNRQKSVLCQVARRAYDRLVARNEITGIDLDTWRHDECERAVGKPGLRDCDNGDYLKLLAHFESLAGEDGRAMNALMRDQTEPKRVAEAVLVSELGKAGLPPNYAESISRDKFHCSVLDCDTRQLWQLIYTVRNRAKARRRTSPASTPASAIHDSTI